MFKIEKYGQIAKNKLFLKFNNKTEQNKINSINGPEFFSIKSKNIPNNLSADLSADLSGNLSSDLFFSNKSIDSYNEITDPIINGGTIGEIERLEIANIENSDITKLTSKSIETQNLEVCNKLKTCDIVPKKDSMLENGKCDLGSTNKWFDNMYVKNINTFSDTVSYYGSKKKLIGTTSLSKISGNSIFKINGKSGYDAFRFGNYITLTSIPDISNVSELHVTDAPDNSDNIVKFCVKDHNGSADETNIRKICLGNDRLDFTRDLSGSIDGGVMEYKNSCFDFTSTLNGVSRDVCFKINGDLNVTGNITNPNSSSYATSDTLCINGDIYCTGSVISTTTEVKNNVTLPCGNTNCRNLGLFEKCNNDNVVYLTDNNDSLVIGSNTMNDTDNKLEVHGDVLVCGTITTHSDKKLKKNIKKIDNPINKIKKIKGVSFDWKQDNKGSYGVIAQDVEKILPNAVVGNNSKSVNYNSIVALLVETCKNQNLKIEILEKKLNYFEKKLNYFENKFKKKT